MYFLDPISESDFLVANLANNLDDEEIDWRVTNQEAVTCFACVRNAFKLYSSARNSRILCGRCGFTFSVQVKENQLNI